MEPAGVPPLDQLQVYASRRYDRFDEFPLGFVARIDAVTFVFAGAAVYVPTMSAVPAARLIFVRPNPVTFAGAVTTLIAVSGAPEATAIGIVKGTLRSTPAYCPDVQVGTAANAGVTPTTVTNR